MSAPRSPQIMTLGVWQPVGDGFREYRTRKLPQSLPRGSVHKKPPGGGLTLENSGSCPQNYKFENLSIFSLVPLVWNEVFW